ncbi:hypothetical protein ACN47E_005387 [Coniothyrium glycines]
MSTNGQPEYQQPEQLHPTAEKGYGKRGTTIEPIEVTGDKARTKHYKPTELRTPFLVAFCVFILIIFTLLQLGAAAFAGAPSLQALQLNRRSVNPEDDCPIGATCLPVPSSWTEPDTLMNPLQSDTPSDSDTPIESDFPSPFLGGTPPTAPNPNAYVKGNGGKYFVGAYLPTLVAIVVGIWWKCIYARLKEMEPFYQMTTVQGAKAKDSLLLSYPRATAIVVLVQSCFSRHGLTFLGTMNMLLITLCTLLASMTLYVEAVGDSCQYVDGVNEEAVADCRMQLAMRPSLAWVLGALLLAIVAATAYIVIQSRRRTSGVFVNPTSIAGAACLCNDELANVPKKSLKKDARPYALISSSERHPRIEVVASHAQTEKPGGSHMTTSKAETNDPFSMYTAALVLFWLFMFGIIVMISYYRWVSKAGTGNRLEDFMNSSSPGVRVFMTFLGLVVKFYWGWIEDYVRTAQPFIALTSPHGASAKTSVLLRSPSSSVTALFYRETWHNLLLGAVTLMAVLSEVLVIALNTIPFKKVVAWQAAYSSMYISIGVLGAMILTLTAVLVWKSRIQKKIPKYPECIVDVFELLGDADGREALRSLCTQQNDGLGSWERRFVLHEVGAAEADVLRWRIVEVS